MPRRAHVCRDTLDEALNTDGPCEHPDGCPVIWEALCRWCGRKFCVRCLGIHFCPERNIDMRLMLDPDLTFAEWVEVEDDGSDETD